jgi:hypothetical protein
MNEITEFKNELMRGVRKNKVTGEVMVKLDKDEIKKQLKRKRLDKSVVEKIKKEFTVSGFKVKENCTSTICVVIPEDKINNNVLTGKDVFN